MLNVLVTLITNKISQDKDADERTKEEQILHIKYLKKQLESDESRDTVKIVNEMTNIIGEDHKVKVFKSRFYSQLLNDPNINQFSVMEVSSERKPISKEVSIQRDVFQKQILANEDIEPISIENAEIEIVAPVLKTSEMKWRANFQGIPISFTLRDFDFKKSVLKKQYSFSNGTMIRCRLEIQQGINTNGDLYYKEVNVFDVSEVFDGTSIIQTRPSQRKKESGSQARLF